MRIFLALLFALNVVMAPAIALAAPASGRTHDAAGPTKSAPAAGDTKPTPPKESLPTGARQLGAIVSVALLTAGVFALAWYTEVMRDSAPLSFFGESLGADDAKATERATYERCYSLAQSQITWWFWVVASSFLYIVWLTPDFFTLGFQGGLTPQALTLMGISAGTALGAAVIDQTKKDKAGPLKDLTDAHAALVDPKTAAADRPALFDKLNAAALGLKSDGYIRDVLSDSDGISLHRFQSFAWTIVLGIIFLVFVIGHSAMPALTDLELSLLGISAGTYLGFKIPEQ